MIKEFATTLSIYFAVALVVLLAASFSEGDAGFPMLFSLVLLVPLYLWKRSYTRKATLSRKGNGRSLKTVLGWSLALFFLALLVRVPSVVLFKMPYEKAPLIYLLTLTIVLVEKTDPWVFGFKTERTARGLLYGLLFFTILQGVFLVVQCLIVYALTGLRAVSSFDVILFFLNLPFQVLLVGVSEEELFRGYIQTSMERFGVFKAIVFQAVLFGLWHFVWDISPFDPTGMFQYITLTFLFGLFLGYFYRKAKSLIPLILVHGLWNSFQSGIVMNENVLKTLGRTSFMSQMLVRFLPYTMAFLAVLVFTEYWVREV